MATSVMDMGGKQYGATAVAGGNYLAEYRHDHSPSSGFVDSDDGITHGDASADPLAGGTARDLPIWTVDQIAEHLNRTGYSWEVNQAGEFDDGVLTFGFWHSIEELQSSYYVNNDGSIAFNEAFYSEDFSPFTAAQEVMAVKGLALWSDLANITFEAVSDTASADITFGNTYTGPGSQAYAYLPFGDIYNEYYAQFGFDEVNKLGGDVWTNGTLSSNFFPATDSYYAQTTLIHELGHALGLSHPGDYNADDGQELSYALADYYQDSNQYSIMSYWDAYETGAQHIDWTLTNFAYAATPMVHDIAAIQRIYGANMETRTGDTVYGFNSTADRSAFDFTVNTRPIVSIWDAGGNDTLDFSGWNTPSIIDLNPGSFSSGGGVIDFPSLEEVNANRAAAGLAPRDQATYDFYVGLRNDLGLTTGLYKDNISIAYGATIENAVGGGGDDLIIANSVANRIDGGLGNDVVSYATATTGVTVFLGTGGIATFGGAAGDVLVSIEGATGSAFNDTLVGDGKSNVIDGGSGGADTLFGSGGIDTLSYASAASAVTVNLGTAKAGGAAAGDIFSGFENLAGSAFGDTLQGDNGDNLLDGGAGGDTLVGGSGVDVLIGNAGADRLTGGKGRDIFRFADTDVDGSRDLLVDFTNGTDTLDLSGIDANVNTSADDAFVRIGKTPFSGTAGELRLVSGLIYGDVDGDGLADFTIELGGTVHLLTGDVIL